jgi:O-acetylhomoserine (thiol)-lyase
MSLDIKSLILALGRPRRGAVAGEPPVPQLPNPTEKRRDAMTLTSKNPETMVLHAGPRRDPASGAVAVPVVQTTSYEFRNTEHAANLFALKEFGNIYSRIMNPTCDALEQKMAALEGGVAALAVSSGQAASALAVQNLCRPGDNIVSSTDLYGGTWNLFANTLPSMGIQVRFVDPADPEAFRKATDGRTRAYYAETLPNPKLTVFPIREVAAIGRSLGVPLIMDNTASPVLCRPIEHGAAIVVHSMTKYIGGHGTSIGGMIVDGGNFDWAAHAKRFPNLNEPDPSYHGAVWTEAVKPLGPIAYIIRLRVVLLRDIGACMSPFNAFQFIQGLETLPLRMREHCRNAAEVALHLQRHPAVTRVIYAGMHNDPEQRRRTTAYLNGGNGGLVGFELKGGREAGVRFIDALKLFYHVANIGDARSLAIHPASTTHSQLSAEDQVASGVTPGYVRLSVGIEHIDDIIADLDQALAATAKPMAAAA